MLLITYYLCMFSIDFLRLFKEIGLCGFWVWNFHSLGLKITISENLLLKILLCVLFTETIPYGLVVRISGFHPGGRGSIPRTGEVVQCWYSPKNFIFFFLIILEVFVSHKEKRLEVFNKHFITITTYEISVMHWRGIEPRSLAWQARILPLNHQCATKL